MKDELYQKKIQQLRNYAGWERDNGGHKIHILDWAADEVERLNKQADELAKALEKILSKRGLVNYSQQDWQYQSLDQMDIAQEALTDYREATK